MLVVVCLTACLSYTDFAVSIRVGWFFPGCDSQLEWILYLLFAAAAAIVSEAVARFLRNDVSFRLLAFFAGTTTTTTNCWHSVWATAAVAHTRALPCHLVVQHLHVITVCVCLLVSLPNLGNDGTNKKIHTCVWTIEFVCCYSCLSPFKFNRFSTFWRHYWVVVWVLMVWCRDNVFSRPFTL